MRHVPLERGTCRICPLLQAPYTQWKLEVHCPVLEVEYDGSPGDDLDTGDNSGGNDGGSDGGGGGSDGGGGGSDGGGGGGDNTVDLEQIHWWCVRQLVRFFLLVHIMALLLLQELIIARPEHNGGDDDEPDDYSSDYSDSGDSGEHAC